MKRLLKKVTLSQTDCGWTTISEEQRTFFTKLNTKPVNILDHFHLKVRGLLKLKSLHRLFCRPSFPCSLYVFCFICLMANPALNQSTAQMIFLLPNTQFFYQSFGATKEVD